MTQLVENPFNKPFVYRKMILDGQYLPFKKKELTGKSLACIFLTRFCSVGCPFCYYKSAPAWRRRNIEDQFSDEGIEKFITFSKKANLGYLLVSGGGEPLNQRKHVLKLVEHIEADRIVLVTSGNWAKNEQAGRRYLEDIYQAFKARKTPNTVVVRISVSEGHTAKIGINPAIHLIKAFEELYAHEERFKLQIKTFDNDPTFPRVLEHFPHCRIEREWKELESDNGLLVKKIPKNYKVHFKNDLSIVVGVSKIFYSGLRPDLSNEASVVKSAKVFDQDMADSEDNFPSIVFNANGHHGIDWAINYNGDVCAWQNQVRDNYMNLYEDDYDKVLQAAMDDPITYSFFDKGGLYREQVISEVDVRAVKRNKAISLRDTSGAILFEEERTRLYYAIRVLQDYVQEGKITTADMEHWPKEIVQLVNLGKEALQALYREGTYTIISQQMNLPFDEQSYRDFLELIKLGHYELTDEQKAQALTYYNQHAQKPIESYEQVTFDKGDVERRLTERLMHIKPLERLIQSASMTPVPRSVSTPISVQGQL